VKLKHSYSGTGMGRWGYFSMSVADISVTVQYLGSVSWTFQNCFPMLTQEVSIFTQLCYLFNLPPFFFTSSALPVKFSDLHAAFYLYHWHC